MLTLPSMWNLIISTLVFFIAAGFSRRYFDSQGLPKSITRGILVFTFASVMSWGSGEIADWIQEKVSGPQPATQTSDDLLQLLKKVD